MTLGVYKFEWPSMRAGQLSGMFVADDADVAAAIGKDVMFGEVLGKHSEVCGTIDEGEITLVSELHEVVDAINRAGGVGYNPLEYIQHQEEEEESDSE